MKKRCAVKQKQQHCCPASLTSDIKVFLLVVGVRAVSHIYCALRRLGLPLLHNMKECAIKKTATSLRDSLVLDSQKSEIKEFFGLLRNLGQLQKSVFLETKNNYRRLYF